MNMKSKLVVAAIPLMYLCVAGCAKKNNLPSAVAAFSYSAVAGNMHAPATIDFTNNGDYAWHFKWQLGDGDTSAEESPSHRYTTAGNYTVTLSAQGFNVDSAKQTVTILPAYASIQVTTIQVQAVAIANGSDLDSYPTTENMGGLGITWTWK